MLEYTKKKWQDIKKVKDLLSFLEDPKANVMELMKTLVDPAKSGFWIAANVDFDLDIDKIINADPEISHDDISKTTRTASEIEHHKKYKFTNGYDRHTPPKEVLEIASALGFKSNPSCHINNQLPGTLMHRHIDFVSCYTYEQSDDKDFLELDYDKERRQPKGQQDIWRCFVALDDWKPGQIVNFEPGFWTKWKKGDVLFFDWRNTPHSTANCGINNRPFLKVTGMLDDDSYVIDARDKGTIKQIKL
tara:strand:- start:1300 stop:2040 length:741 start_codon:yes stop_codon:yes gene_type:complete